MDVWRFRTFLYCVLVVGSVLKMAESKGRVQIRVDSFTVERDTITTESCCNAGSCACETHMRTCVYVRNGTACGDSELQTSPKLSGDFNIGRTATLFDIEIDARPDNLALRVQMRYGPVGLGSLINEYTIDISSVPVGNSALEAPWIAFTASNGIRPSSKDRLRVQVKVFCATDYYGEQCSALCQRVPGKYTCNQRTGQRECLNHWLPPLCEVVDVCQRYPCLNGGTCHGRTDGGYTCTCNPNYTGSNCSLAVDSCASNPCERGVCHDQIDSYVCICPPGYTGRNCQQPPNDCRAVSCQNNGQCVSVPGPSGAPEVFQCQCPLGFFGALCEQDICSPSPCRHGGTCLRHNQTQWVCTCPVGFTGATCDVPFPCASRPCRNGGLCLQTEEGDYRCDCPQLYTGHNCETLDPCLNSPCANGGTCSPLGGTFTCTCSQGWSGATCHTRDPCASRPCGPHGWCQPSTSVSTGFQCNCNANYTGDTCHVLHPCVSGPCLNGGQCSTDGSGQVQCTCRQGFSGDRCQVTDQCGGNGGGFNNNPCANGGSCVNTQAGFVCLCQTGYTGPHCQVTGPCVTKPCLNGGSCFAAGSGNDYMCRCVAPFTGTNCESRNPCNSSPCRNNGACQSSGTGFTCRCPQGFSGHDCSQADVCNGHQCLNGGRCVALSAVTYRCQCPQSFLGPSCEYISPCYANPCLNGGTCNTLTQAGTSPSYSCTCPVGFRGRHCEDDGRLCQRNPCQHGGTCHVISGGSDVVCQCPAGWGGPRCENDVSACRYNPCVNGGSCVTSSGTGSGFLCRCPPNYVGERCQTSLVTSTSTTTAITPVPTLPTPTPSPPDPCRHHACNVGATCLSQPGGGYSCRCPPHLTGELCQFTVNLCNGYVCQNGGVCRSTTTGQVCQCPAYFQGPDCSAPRDPCSGNLCHSPNGVCVPRDFTAQGFVCQCKEGFGGQFCEQGGGGGSGCNALSRPCANGGSCVQVGAPGLFQCICTTGYTGPLCEHVNYCSSAPCLNGGNCTNRPLGTASNGYMCTCLPGYRGPRCEESTSPTTSPTTSPGTNCQYNGFGCRNGGQCLTALDGSYFCQCTDGYRGRFCEQTVTQCGGVYCKNFGSCLNSQCQCLDGWTGRDCSVWEPASPCTLYCGQQGVCYLQGSQQNCYCPDPEDTCSIRCTSPFAYMVHPYNCHLFIQCDWGKPYVKSCSGNLHFNPYLQVCDWQPNAGCIPSQLWGQGRK